MGAVANGTKPGVAAPSSTTIASPVPVPAPDGPLAAPHQLQLASTGVVMFDPTRRPAWAFPAMSLNRTWATTGGEEGHRLPPQIAPGRARAGGDAHARPTPPNPFRSRRAPR